MEIFAGVNATDSDVLDLLPSSTPGRCSSSVPGSEISPIMSQASSFGARQERKESSVDVE